jgi:hypothetical protein
MQSSGAIARPLVVPPQPRVAVLGCSLASGLGVREQSVGRVAAATLGAEAVLFKARARAGIDDVLAVVPRVGAFRPDLVIVSSGNVEALVHPRRVVEHVLERCAPKGWHGDVGLDPRPYFSADPAKARRQKVESAAKVLLKNILVRPFGGYTRMSLTEYEPLFRRLLEELTATGAAVVVLGPSKVSPLFFPHSQRNLARFERLQRSVIEGRPDVRHLSVRELLDARTQLQADRAHPTVAGHARLAAAVVSAVEVRAAAAATEPR